MKRPERSAKRLTDDEVRALVREECETQDWRGYIAGLIHRSRRRAWFRTRVRRHRQWRKRR
jgi:hypothetical protein